MTDYQPEELFKQAITALVAVVASLSLLIDGNNFNLWTTIVGITLLIVLHTYGYSKPTSRNESITYAAVWSLCLILAVGGIIFFTTSSIIPLMPFFTFKIGALHVQPLPLGLYTLIFIIWLIAFVIKSKNKSQK
jgi:hypothetical protein